jgi:hypothetical protein
MDGRIILKWIFEKWDRVSWKIHVTQNTERWLTLANAVLKLRVS